MYEEKEPVTLPFAVDKKDAAVQCIAYFAVFTGLAAVLIGLMASRDYDAAKSSLILGIYALIALATWLPMLLRYVAVLHLEPEGVRITAFGVTLRRYPLGKIRFVSAMACSGKNRTAGRSQILLSAYTFEELAKKGGWQRGGEKPADECARQYLNRYANAYYARELNLTPRALWLDWAPDRLRLIRWLYPDAQWMDFTKDKSYEKQL